MSNYYPIDLEPYYNHKLVYARDPKRETKNQERGLDNIYILKSNLKIDQKISFEGVEFAFSFGRYDNIICGSQNILINKTGKKLHFICFAYWGDVYEHLRVIYDDASERIIKIPFIDWAYELENDIQRKKIYFGSNISMIKKVVSSGETIQFIYLYHITYEFEEIRKIREIVLPENMFAHIFAITVEE